jgi:nucleoside-diphosphate-sugar epimerase
LARLGRPLPVHGDGSQIREFTYIDDIVEANVRAGGASIEPGAVVNLSGGTSTSLNEVLDLLEEIHGEPLQVDRGEPALGDVFRTGGSTERAKALLGWEPRVGIEKGLALEYEWLARRDG